MNQTFENKASALYAWNANRGTFKTEDEAQGFLDANRAHLNEGEISRLMEDWRGKYGTSSDISTLQQKVKNVTAGNGTEGAMGYGEFLKNYGSDTQKNYSEAVKTANDAYYRALSTYGKNAESLAGAGLTGAGVSDYGSAAAWGARQGAVATAGAAKQVADAENARSFAQYLENYKAQKTAEAANANAMRSSAIKEAMAMGYTDAGAATEYLKATGYFSDEEAAQYATTIANYYVGEQQKAEAAANEEKKQAAINTAVQSGLEGEAFVAYLVYNGYTDEEAREKQKMLQPLQDQILGNDQETKNNNAYTEYNALLAQGNSEESAKKHVALKYGEDAANFAVEGHKDDIVATAVDEFEKNLSVYENGTAGYNPFANGNVLTIANLDAAKAMYGIDDTTYDSFKNRICAINEKWISDNMSMARAGDQIDRVLSNLGITATEGADNEEMQREAIKALKSRSFDLYYKGEITQQNMTNVLSDYYTEEIEAAKDAGHDKKLQTACAALVQAKQDGEKMGDESFYQKMVEALAEEVVISKLDWKDAISSGLMNMPSGLLTALYGAAATSSVSYRISFGSEVSFLPYMQAVKLSSHDNYPFDLAITANDYSKVEDFVGDGLNKAPINLIDIPTMYTGEQKTVLYDVVQAAKKKQGFEDANTKKASLFLEAMKKLTKNN